MRPNGWAFSGEPMRAKRAARVRCNAMLGGRFGPDQLKITLYEAYAYALARAQDRCPRTGAEIALHQSPDQIQRFFPPI